MLAKITAIKPPAEAPPTSNSNQALRKEGGQEIAIVISGN
jgi:hypothetical protein